MEYERKIERAQEIISELQTEEDEITNKLNTANIAGIFLTEIYNATSCGELFGRQFWDGFNERLQRKIKRTIREAWEQRKRISKNEALQLLTQQDIMAFGVPIDTARDLFRIFQL